jgi:hypothetical protein
MLTGEKEYIGKREHLSSLQEVKQKITQETFNHHLEWKAEM